MAERGTRKPPPGGKRYHAYDFMPTEAHERMGPEGWWTVWLDDQPWRIDVCVERVDGVPQLTGLRLAREPEPGGGIAEPADAVITAERLRKLPLRALRADALAYLDGQTDRVGQELFKRFDERPPGGAWPDDHYREVAAEYLRAVQRGLAPLVAIGERWHVGRAMASKYVKRARELKYLGYPARRGVAGTSEPISPVSRGQDEGASL
ncbi:MAG: hypothetical protein M3083_22270 [Actinomycetota bacterium]|nr:hypothetical protein [Actinomycetota bacterium]